MSERPLWIGEEEIAGAISPTEAIDALACAYADKAAGRASSMARAHLRIGERILHAVGGAMNDAGLAGTKTWTYTPGGASPLLILFSLEDGSVRAVIEAFSLGQLRTSATTGLGTRLLAREDAATLALIGTGKQAFSQARMVTTVRPIQQIRLFGRDVGRRHALAERLSSQLGVEVTEFSDVAEAVIGADVVTTITRSADPVLTGEMMAAGMHVNAVGSIVPTRRELDETAVGRCSVIVADSLEQAREDAGELRAASTGGDFDWSVVRDLSEAVGTPTRELRSTDDITLFKSLGVGLADVALGVELLRRITADGDGEKQGLTVSHG
jgi:ornithine cyclodeaminase